MGEYVRVRQNVRLGEEVREVTNTAWQLTGSVVLTGETPAFRGVVPGREFDLEKGQWGAWEVVARVNELSLDPAIFPLLADPARSAQSATALGAGVNWYLNRAVRLLVNYERTRFGAPAGAVSSRPTEQVLISRVQLSF
jgi:phosphate-selective porin OprO and OprP